MQLKIYNITLSDEGLYGCQESPDGMELLRNFSICSEYIFTLKILLVREFHY